MGLFLRAHRARLARARIEQAGLLYHLASRFDEFDLALYLVVDSAHHETHGIHVLNFGASAERITGAVDRDIDVAPHGALIHVAVAGPEITQDRTQFAHIDARLLGAAQIRLGHDLHQRDARPVEIDIGAGGMLVVHQLAGVLLDMDALDTDHLGAGFRVLLVQHDLDLPFTHDRVIELADLIALRQIGVEIIFPVEP